jgi:hypothetical protein
MHARRVFTSGLCCFVVMGGFALRAQTPASASSSRPSSSSSKSKPARKPVAGADSQLDAGTVTASLYRNAGIGFTCKIPTGWVLRTEEMNARADDEAATADKKPISHDQAAGSLEGKRRAALGRTAEGGCPHTDSSHVESCGRVLLAAFSRPPEARGEDVNSSILIAAESVAAYPGLKEAAQYLGPVSEVAKAQGFKVVTEPYEFLAGTKPVVRGDFQKDIGSRVMRQSTLVIVARGYAVSFTFVGGTEDEVEELVQDLSFGTGATSAR